MQPTYFTKSRFKLAMDCPTKLFYAGKEEYANRTLDDPFLEALVEGGLQIGELAKAYYPGGYEIKSLDKKEALKETEELLKQDNCIIYEAVIEHENLFARVDILVKEGNDIQIIEVKSKSADFSENKINENNHNKLFQLVTGDRKGEIRPAWKPYVYDIAFQTYVAELALPAYEITPYLMLVDKHAICPTDGLNKKFKLKKVGKSERYSVVAEGLTDEDLSVPLVAPIDMKTICRKVIHEDTYAYEDKMVSFQQLVNIFADNDQANRRMEAEISSKCKHCEFRASEAQLKAGLKSGFRECFKLKLDWKEEDFAEDSIFSLWNFRDTDEMIQQGKLKLSSLSKEDIGYEESDEPGLSKTERQWLQIKKSRDNDPTYYLDKQGLESEMNTWTFPYHFIDFETATPIIPYNKGRRPNQLIAFQFSHHVVYEDGTIEHKSQFLHREPGVNPNYSFVRALKKALENDEGTIFCYGSHENRVLNNIYDELIADESFIPDRDELCDFIESITQRKQGEHLREGPRNMVDLLELVKSYYYDPYMKGSNSIKVVLPAILNSSDYLQEKYSKPIYGAEKGIKSLNFNEKTWIEFENGKVVDPYKRLPKLFEDISDVDTELLNVHAELNNGSAASVAYERLQTEDLPDEIRTAIETGLLKYCELDTLAMVMIYEAWVEMMKEA